MITFDRASQILELAQIIQDEEGLEANAAYARAEQELDAVQALVATADRPTYHAPAPLALRPTSHGLVLTQGANQVVISPGRADQVLAALRHWASDRRRVRKIARHMYFHR